MVCFIKKYVIAKLIYSYNLLKILKTDNVIQTFDSKDQF